MIANKKIKLALILLLIVVIYILIHHYRINRYLSTSIFENYHDIVTYQTQYPILFILTYILTYIILIASCIPGTIILDLFAGFLFGTYLGSILVIISYTIGSVLNFVIIRYFFSNTLSDKFKKFNYLIKGGNKTEVMLNLIGLRLVAIIPFWVVNIIAAIFNVSFGIFLISTIIGVTPFSVIYSVIGAELHTIANTNQELSMHLFLKPKVYIILSSIAILLMLPNIIKLIQRNKKPRF